ncbi:MAG TPA: hypothetical protein VM238_02825 [Phycisphaerae bacterium]|nr:hypothetical protein [Phycisphaerae bacterium]
MARQYSPKTFLRQTPNVILKQYFTQKNLLGEIDFDTLGETEVEPIFAALEQLPPEGQATIERDFCAINELAAAAGTQAILEEATTFWKRGWADQFEAMKNHYERAFWTFLNEPRIFGVAGDIAFMDRIGSWRHRFVGANLTPGVGPSDLKALGDGVSSLYVKEGRGRHCKVDNYLRQNLERHCYFAYPEDYATTDMEFDEEGQFQHRPRKPAFENIFVYRPAEGLLEVHAYGKKEHIEALMEVFCQAILGMEKLPDESKKRVYDLSDLRSRGVSFVTDPADGVESVTVRRLRMDLPGSTRRRIILEANASPRSPQAIYDLMDQALNKENIPLGEVTLSQAKLRFTFASRDGRKGKTLTFEISIPDGCTLKDDPQDQVAKKYLRKWGLIRE